MLKKLRIKFVLLTMGIVVVMLAVIFGLICLFLRTSMEDTCHNTLQSIAQAATKPGGIRDLPRDAQLPYFVVYFNQRGEFLAGGYTHYDLNDQTVIMDIVNETVRGGGKTGLLETYRLMYRIEKTHTADVYIYLDVSTYDSMFMTLLSTCALVGAVSILLFLGLSILLAHWMVRPVEKAWKQQRQFVSDASHELKTPLTVIISNAELLQGTENDRQSSKRFAENILTMSKQMGSLVAGLLELARADNGQAEKTLSVVIIQPWLLMRYCRLSRYSLNGDYCLRQICSRTYPSMATNCN